MEARNKSTMTGTSPENEMFVVVSKRSVVKSISRGSMAGSLCNTDSCAQRILSSVA